MDVIHTSPTAKQMGSAEGRSPSARGLGVSPKPPQVPQDWGI